MNPPPQHPRWVRDLEVDEAVWAAFRRRRALRFGIERLSRLLGQPCEEADASEDADWLAAQQECGQVVEAHGQWSEAGR